MTSVDFVLTLKMLNYIQFEILMIITDNVLVWFLVKEPPGMKYTIPKIHISSDYRDYSQTLKKLVFDQNYKISNVVFHTLKFNKPLSLLLISSYLNRSPL